MYNKVQQRAGEYCVASVGGGGVRVKLKGHAVSHAGDTCGLSHDRLMGGAVCQWAGCRV